MRTHKLLILAAFASGSFLYLANRNSSPGAQLMYQPGCLAGDAKILMGNQQLKEIDKIKPGDTIINIDLRNHRTMRKEVVHNIEKVTHNSLVEISFENTPMTIKSTPDHPFFVDGKFWCSANPQLTVKNCGIKVQEIVAGDHCIIYQQGHMSVLTVKAIKPVSKTMVTYNLTGLKITNYFANYLLVSNEAKPEI